MGDRVMKELHTELPMAACRSCGRMFETARELAKVQERLQSLRLHDDAAQTCPACRGREFLYEMERTLGLFVPAGRVRV